MRMRTARLSTSMRVPESAARSAPRPSAARLGESPRRRSVGCRICYRDQSASGDEQRRQRRHGKPEADCPSAPRPREGLARRRRRGQARAVGARLGRSAVMTGSPEPRSPRRAVISPLARRSSTSPRGGAGLVSMKSRREAMRLSRAFIGRVADAEHLLHLLDRPMAAARRRRRTPGRRPESCASCGGAKAPSMATSLPARRTLSTTKSWPWVSWISSCQSPVVE